MKIIFLTNNYDVAKPLLEFLRFDGNEVAIVEEDITLAPIRVNAVYISYGYRHIIGQPAIRKIRGRAINLHIAYLPWNRGADPNFWSWVDDTPKGVTIHWIDEGVDTGKIIHRRLVDMGENETLASSYDKLQAAIQDLFREEWRDIKDLLLANMGSYHAAKEKERYAGLLTDGWNTPVKNLRP
jgi:methionyl-tRNA formyltransferase